MSGEVFSWKVPRVVFLVVFVLAVSPETTVPTVVVAPMLLEAVATVAEPGNDVSPGDLGCLG